MEHHKEWKVKDKPHEDKAHFYDKTRREMTCQVKARDG